MLTTIRFAALQASHLHFVAAPEYARRVLGWASAGARIDFGAPGWIRCGAPLLDRAAVEEYLGMGLGTHSFW